MKAVVYERYGAPDVLRIEDVPSPVPGARRDPRQDPRDGGNTAPTPTFAPASRSSAGSRRGSGDRSGRSSGTLAGEVEAVGEAVTEFAVGDRVFGALPYLALSTGAHAEYMCVPERFPLAHMPAGMSFEEAGAVGDGALLTLNCLRPAGSLEGKRILVYGASGSIGTAGVQLAKHFGAHVTAVCNTKNVELARSAPTR